MEIFESSDGKGKCVIFLEKKEAKELLSAFEIACDARPKKINIKKMLKEFNSKLACF